MKLRAAIFATSTILLSGCQLFSQAPSETQIKSLGTHNDAYASEGASVGTFTMAGQVTAAEAGAKDLLGKQCSANIELFDQETDAKANERQTLDVSLRIDGLEERVVQKALEQNTDAEPASGQIIWSASEIRVSQKPKGPEPYYILVQSLSKDLEDIDSIVVSTETTDGGFMLTCTKSSRPTEDGALARVKVENTSVRGNPISLIGIINNEASCQGGTPLYKSTGTLELEVPVTVTQIGICGMGGGGARGGMDYKIIDVSGRLKAGEVLVIRNDSLEARLK